MSKLYKLFNGLKISLKEAVRNLINYDHLLRTAKIQYHDDLYLVSFPKSGATWMDFLMANVHLQMSGQSRNVTFFNVHNFIPDIHDSRDVKPLAMPFPGFRVMKSHSNLNPYYKNVVYVIRDPRDVMVSYYHFMRGLGAFNGTISDFIHSEKYGIHAWVKHSNGWWESSPASLPFILIKFEDLQKDAAGQLIRLYEFIGYDVPMSVIEKAVELSGFDVMKTLEKKLNYGGRPVGKNFNFMRKGKSGTSSSDLSAEDMQYIEKVAGALLDTFGYK